MTASHDVIDTVIVGQGLAGTTLAWRLIEAGQRVLVIDDAAPVSASKVSAGLVTPIMGQKFTRNDEPSIAAARLFYRRIEKRLGIALLQDLTAVRLFTNETEAALFARRRADLAACFVTPQPEPLLPFDLVDTTRGGFAMHSAQLDVAAYLTASRAALPIRPGRVDMDRDITRTDHGLTVCGQATKRVIFCEGFLGGSKQGAGNMFFPGLPWQNVKGDLLLIRTARRLPRVSIHARHWIAPTQDPDVFRVGATSNWDLSDTSPSADKRAALASELDAVLRCGYDIVDHMAAVRPVIRGGPRIGASATDARILLFNGLGTKGASRAPLLADLLARHIIDGAPVPPQFQLG